MSERLRRAVSSRRVALEALVKVDEGGYSNLLLAPALDESGLDARDRAWVTHHVYGTLRLQRRLDAMVQPFCRRRIDDLDVPVRAALRLGAHQLLEGVSAHAAVGETVGVVTRHTRSLVNAVLRRVAQSGPPWEEPSELGVAMSHPDWMVDRLMRCFGPEDCAAVLATDNRPPPVTLRVKPGESVDEIVGQAASDGVTLERGSIVAEALLARSGGSPRGWTVVTEGRASVQDQASQAVVNVLAPELGERVIEVGAAPGGKTAAIGERVGESGLVVAVDRDRNRSRRIVDNTQRLGLRVAFPVVADANALPTAAKFDGVLVDAPCSGLGVLARRAELRWRVSEADVLVLAGMQRGMLEAAAPLVRPGGRLVYSVCTWTEEETVQIGEWAAGALRGFDFLAIPEPWREHGRGGLLLPRDGCDGMFVAAWQRRGR